MFYAVALEELVDENDEEYGYFSIEAVDEDILDWPWLHGERFSELPATPIRMRIDLNDDDAGDFPDIVTGPVPLASQRLRAALEACGAANVEYFEVTVEGSKEFDGFPMYFAMNIVGLVQGAAAGTVSTQAFGHTGADIVEKFVPSETAAIDQPIFRLAEHLATVMVSEKVRKACMKAKIDTLRFIPADKWST